MALDRDNRQTYYVVGRMIAIAEHYAGNKFGQLSLSNMFTNPAPCIDIWRRYIDTNDEYYQELADFPLPVTTENEVVKSQAWVGYYHQKAAYGPDNEQERKRIGRRIADLRKEQNLTQAQLADRCGLQQAHIARVELGKYSVGLDTLAQIAKALGMTIDFVSGE